MVITEGLNLQTKLNYRIGFNLIGFITEGLKMEVASIYKPN